MATTTSEVTAQVCVQTQQMPLTNITTYGTTLTFDFSAEAGSGSVLAYCVGLAGFQAQYASQSIDKFQSVQQFGVNLVPNLVGNQVTVTANLILTDYDGNAAGEEQDYPGLLSYVTVTVIAIVGTSFSDNWTLCNIFGLPAESSSPPASPNIPIPASSTSSTSQQFISGFNFAYESGTKKDVLSITVKSTTSGGTQTNTVSPSGTVTMDPNKKYTSSSTIDLGYLAVALPTSGEIQTFQIVPVSPSWNKPDGSSGITGSFSETITGIPAGYQIQSAGFLMSQIIVEFGNDYHQISTIAAGLQGGAPTVSSTTPNVVSGSLMMNIFSTEAGHPTVSSSSSLTGYLLVVFEPIP